MNHIPLADTVVIVLYFLSMLLMGLWLGKRNKSADQFTTASGKMPGWAIGMSLFGTFLSSNTFIGNPGKAFGGNWNSFVFTLTLPIAALIGVKYLIPFFRRSGGLSAYGHFEKRFGPWARTYAVCCFLLTQLARTGTIFLGVGLTLNALTGMDIRLIILITGGVVTLYTVMGGMEAVIWTEVVQSIIKTAGALLVLALIVMGVRGGAGQIWQTAIADHKLGLGSLKPSFTTDSFWVVFLYGLCMNLTNFGVDQNYVQRYHTASSEKSAAKSLWLCVYMYVPASLLFLIIGTCLYSYYHQHTDMLMQVKEQVAAIRLGPGAATSAIHAQAAALTDADIGDKVLPHFIVHKVPAGLVGLIFAAILSAAMGTISSGFNSSATIYMVDIHKRYINPGITDRQQLRILYIATIFTGLLATGTGISMIGAGSVLDLWWKLSGIFAGGMLGLFSLAMIARHAGHSAALVGVITGTLVIGWLVLSQSPGVPSWLRNPLHANMTVVVGTLSIFLTGVLVQKLRTRKYDTPVKA
ncbi:MAG: sodium:solute symporter [Bacteroidetes bacterium]|nr:sodium:solute symporter [Bacteroidota bacterium]